MGKKEEFLNLELRKMEPDENGAVFYELVEAKTADLVSSYNEIPIYCIVQYLCDYEKMIKYRQMVNKEKMHKGLIITFPEGGHLKRVLKVIERTEHKVYHNIYHIEEVLEKRRFWKRQIKLGHECERPSLALINFFSGLTKLELSEVSEIEISFNFLN